LSIRALVGLLHTVPAMVAGYQVLLVRAGIGMSISGR
jgi:hypothetical protein